MFSCAGEKVAVICTLFRHVSYHTHVLDISSCLLLFPRKRVPRHFFSLCETVGFKFFSPAHLQHDLFYIRRNARLSCLAVLSCFSRVVLFCRASSRLSGWSDIPYGSSLSHGQYGAEDTARRSYCEVESVQRTHSSRTEPVDLHVNDAVCNLVRVSVLVPAASMQADDDDPEAGACH